jgi:hypothetical protein
MTSEMKGKASLPALLAALEVINDAMGERATLRHARLLLEVAIAGEVDQGMIAKKIGPTATVRMVQSLGPSGPYKDDEGRRREGLGLINSEQDAVDYRLRKLTLTSDGKSLVNRIQGRMEGKR